MEQALEKENSYGYIKLSLEETATKVREIRSLLNLFCLACNDNGETKIRLIEYLDILQTYTVVADSVIDNIEDCAGRLSELEQADIYVSAEKMEELAQRLIQKRKVQDNEGTTDSM